MTKPGKIRAQREHWSVTADSQLSFKKAREDLSSKSNGVCPVLGMNDKRGRENPSWRCNGMCPVLRRNNKKPAEDAMFLCS